jgi:hypothetical protein
MEYKVMSAINSVARENTDIEGVYYENYSNVYFKDEDILILKITTNIDVKTYIDILGRLNNFNQWETYVFDYIVRESIRYKNKGIESSYIKFGEEEVRSILINKNGSRSTINRAIISLIRKQILIKGMENSASYKIANNYDIATNLQNNNQPKIIVIKLYNNKSDYNVPPVEK